MTCPLHCYGGIDWTRTHQFDWIFAIDRASLKHDAAKVSPYAARLGADPPAAHIELRPKIRTKTLPTHALQILSYPLSQFGP
jgi:hypothetical protein